MLHDDLVTLQRQLAAANQIIADQSRAIAKVHAQLIRANDAVGHLCRDCSDGWGDIARNDLIRAAAIILGGGS